MHACGNICKYMNISFVQADQGSTLSAPAPLPRIPGFSPATTTSAIASARAPTANNPAPPARRRSASFSFEPADVDVPLADSLLVDLHFCLSLRCLASCIFLCCVCFPFSHYTGARHCSMTLCYNVAILCGIILECRARV